MPGPIFQKSYSPISTKWGLRLISMTAFALGWEFFARAIDSLLFPTFFETVSALIILLGSDELWQAFFISNQAMVAGFILALLVGLPLGFILGIWESAEKFLNPYINIMLVTPMSAMIPLMIIAFGLGFIPRVLVIFIYSFVYVTINTRAGLRNVDSYLVDMARTFGATRKQIWRKIFIPSAIPAVMTGIRVGLGRALTGMVAVELLLVALGLGRLILYFRGNFEAGMVYAVIFVIISEAVLLMGFVRYLELRLIPWESEVGLE